MGAFGFMYDTPYKIIRLVDNSIVWTDDVYDLKIAEIADLAMALQVEFREQLLAFKADLKDLVPGSRTLVQRQEQVAWLRNVFRKLRDIWQVFNPHTPMPELERKT